MKAGRLYQEVLLRQAKAPTGAGVVGRGEADGEGENPLCGDEIRVKLVWGGDGRLVGVRHETRGCALCRAGAGLMAELLRGKTAEEAAGLAGEVLGAMGRVGFAADSPLAAFNGVEAFPSRVACAKLPWEAVERALRGGKGTRGGMA